MSTIYIHWPFCLSKCYYCDFNSVAIEKRNCNAMRYLPLYKNVLNAFRKDFYKGESITSIYFGGGTPSLLPVEFVIQLLSYIQNTFNLSTDIEVTLEANPKTINRQKALGFRTAGINRLSIGVQSLIDTDLRMLGRIHSAYDALMCVYDMHSVFDNISIDLIYNRPGQKINDWEVELNNALELPIQHVSLYELIIENDTYMKRLINKGFLQAPSMDATFFEKTLKITKKHKFDMYEVSNFAKNSNYNSKLSNSITYSRHNLSYWNYEDYYGIGAGAHSRVHNTSGKKCAISQIDDINAWCKWANAPTFNTEELSNEDIYLERLLMGLRTKFGVDYSDFDMQTLRRHQFHKKVKFLQYNNYATNNDECLILTREGLQRMNLVLKYLTI